MIQVSNKLVNCVNTSGSRRKTTDLKKSIDRHASKHDGQDCPVHGAHENTGQFFFVIIRACSQG